MSDADSALIKEFGILNTLMPEDHEWYGIPFPGTYMVGDDGRVIEKSFLRDHGHRDSINTMMQEGFHISDMEHGEIYTATTQHLDLKAYFAAPTIRRAQINILTIEIQLNEHMHVYGRPLPDGYIPISVAIDCEQLEIEDISYPEPEAFEFAALQETLPSYTGAMQIKARCRGISHEEGTPFDVPISVRYQACDGSECYLPQNIDFSLQLTFLGTDWERV